MQQVRVREVRVREGRVRKTECVRTPRRSLWRRWVLSAAVAAIASTAGLSAQTAPPPRALTLDDALALAMTGNQTIAAARLRRPVDTAGIDVARERPNPEFTFETTRETPRVAFSGMLPIELGGKRERRIDLASATVTTDDAEIDRIVAIVRNDVRRAYFEVVAADRRVTANAELRDVARRVRETAQTSFELGDRAQVDVYEAALELATADNDVTAAESELAATRAELSTLLGQAPGAPIQLADDFIAAPLPSLDALVARATVDNVDLRVIDRQIAEQTARRNLARTLRTSDVSVGGSATFDSPPEFHVGWRTALTFTMPLLTHHDAEVVVEDAELTHLNGERAALLADITGAVAAARARADGARERVLRFQSDILPGALRVEQMQEDAYRSGQTNVNVLLEALHTTRDLRAKSLDAGLDYQRALADLERALGTSIK